MVCFEFVVLGVLVGDMMRVVDKGCVSFFVLDFYD